MEDKIIKLLNGNDILQSNISTYQEIFIRYYGEEYREKITNILSNTLWIGIQSPIGIKRQLGKLEKEKTQELGNDIIRKLNSQLSLEDIFSQYSFSYSNIHPLYYYQLLRKSFLLGEEGRKEQFIQEGYERIVKYDKELTKEEFKTIFDSKIIPEKYKRSSAFQQLIEDCIDDKKITKRYEEQYKKAEPLLKKINPEINIDNFDQLLTDSSFNKLNQMLNLYQKAKTEFLSYKSKFQKYYDIITEYESIQERLNNNYYDLFVLENIELIPENDRQEIIQYIKNRNNKQRNFQLENKINIIFGVSLHILGSLDSFSKEAEEELLDPNTGEWRRRSIQKKRIEYWQLCGIDLGNNYEDYKNNKEAQARKPSVESLQKLDKSRNEIKNKMTIALYESLSSFHELRKKVDSKNFLDKDDFVNARLYLLGETFISPNISLKNGRVELSPLLFINLDDEINQGIDHFIIHEINHLIELSLQKVTSDSYTTTCGWEEFVTPLNRSISQEDDLLKAHEIRPYELFNEIINEKIAQEISKQMHDNQIYIFDTPQESKYTKLTSYEFYNFLIEEFYQEFKKEIQKSRQEGRIEIIWDAVGKENFDELNNLIINFTQKVDGFKIYQLLRSLKNGEDTELTRLYQNTLIKRDIIIEKMKMYKDINNMEEKEEKINESHYH